MIQCFSPKIKTFLKNNSKKFTATEDDVQNIMPTCDDINCECPSCKALNKFSAHDSYRRNIVFVRAENTYSFNVSVNRIICNSCGHTHALLPSFIVPYKTFSRDSILYIVSEFFSSSALMVQEKLQLSFQLIYSLVAIFLSFFFLVDSLNRDKKIYKSFDKTFFKLHSLVFCDDDFSISFFERYKWIFLMTKFRNMKSPPIYIGISISPST